jgi:hypothetical protein
VEDDAGALNVLLRAITVRNDGGEALAVSAGEENARRLGHAPKLARRSPPLHPQNASMH